jgi:hypothetical protein
MSSTTEQRTSASPTFKIGDHVYIKDFCRGCDRDRDRLGTVIRFIPALSASVEVLTTKEELADWMNGATEDRYVVLTSKVGFPAVHEFHHAHQLFPAQNRWQPFCEWCGKRQQRPTLHASSACQDFCRTNGRPPTAEEWDEMHNGVMEGDAGASPDWLDSGTPEESR